MKRVVITGIGILCPNASNIEVFTKALRLGKSGVQFIPELQKLGFRCQVGGICKLDEHNLFKKYPHLNLPNISRSTKLLIQATDEAINNSKLDIKEFEFADIIIGSTISSSDLWGEKIVDYTNNLKHLKLGSTAFEQIITSSPASMLSGILGTKSRVISNSLACASSTESIIEGYRRIKNSENKLIIAGGVEPYSKYYWATMDAMKITNPNYNDKPEKASRPMSGSARGFIPAEGAAVVILEEYEHAKNRNVKIYAEIIGEHINCGGQQNGGSMTASNIDELKNCIRSSIVKSKIDPEQINYISGHLTGTKADPTEIKAWKDSLNIKMDYFPYINSTKSLIGHSIGACGAIEIVASVLQMQNNFIHPSINCEDIHPEIEKIIDISKIPQKNIENIKINYAISSNFGFGDVNASIVLKNLYE